MDTMSSFPNRMSSTFYRKYRYNDEIKTALKNVNQALERR